MDIYLLRIPQNYPLNEDPCGMKRSHISYLSNRTDEDFKLLCPWILTYILVLKRKKLDQQYNKKI